MTGWQIGQQFAGQAEQIELADLVKYACASGDYNPLHFDEAYAKSKGQSSVLVHGMLGAGILSALSTNLAGTEGFVKSFDVRFVKTMPVNSRLQSKAQVTAINPVLNGTEYTVNLWLENEQGETTIKGNACIFI